MARRKTKGELSRIWRILLVPMLAGYVWLLAFMNMDALAFVKSAGSATMLEYGRNYVVLAACVLGFLMLVFGSAGRRLMLAAALALMTLPVWLDPFVSYSIGSVGTKAIGEIAFDKWPSMLGTMSAAFWGVLMVRGPKKREWEKAVIGLIMLARVGLITLRGEEMALSWVYDAFVMGVSVLIGAAVDCVYSGPALPDLIVPLCACAWVVLSLIEGALDVTIALYGTIVIALVAATAFICMKPLRKRYLGYIFALAGVAASCASILLVASMV